MAFDAVQLARSLAAVAGRKLTPFHGADGAGALQGIGRQWHPFVAAKVGEGLEGCGPSQPSVRRDQHRFTVPTELTPSGESASNGPALVATMNGGDLEG